MSEKNTPKSKYIGGTSREVRYRVLDEPLVTDSILTIANRYGLDPSLLATRLAHEGFADRAVQVNNEYTKGEYPATARDMDSNNDGEISLQESINRTGGPNSGFVLFGLDDTGERVENGQVKIIEPWITVGSGSNKNEDGRTVNSAVFVSEPNYENNTNGYWSQGISVMAAELRSRYEAMKKAFPNFTEDLLQKATSIAYNRGINGAIQYIQKNGIDGSSYNLNYRVTNGTPRKTVVDPSTGKNNTLQDVFLFKDIANPSLPEPSVLDLNLQSIISKKQGGIMNYLNYVRS